MCDRIPPRKIGCEGSTHPVSNRLILDPNPINTFAVEVEERRVVSVIWKSTRRAVEYDGLGRREGAQVMKAFCGRPRC